MIVTIKQLRDRLDHEENTERLRERRFWFVVLTATVVTAIVECAYVVLRR